MIVVTAGTSEYRQIIDAQARKCKEFGYTHVIHDLGGLGVGSPWAVEIEDLQPTVNGDSLPPATFKAELLRQAMNAAKPGELVMWLDADCIPLKKFEPAGNWDAAVTLRPVPEMGLSRNPALDYLNSGVVWIRNTPCGVRFCEAWAKFSKELNTDQGALNEIAGPSRHEAEYNSAKAWNRARGKVVNGFAGTNVLILDALEWNCWHFPPPPEARIMHFKGGIRYLAKDYLNR